MTSLSDTPTLFGASLVLSEARSLKLNAGEQITGIVVQLPQHGAAYGNCVFLRSADGDTVSLDASRKRGSTVLARELEARNITVGTEITIAYRGWRESQAGHRYRQFEVRRGHDRD